MKPGRSIGSGSTPDDIRLELPKKKITLKRREDIVKLCRGIADQEREYVLVISLKQTQEVSNIRIVSMGSRYESRFNPSTVFRAAIVDESHGIVVVHNHPGGNVKPSKADKKCLKRLMKISESSWTSLSWSRSLSAVRSGDHSFPLRRREIMQKPIPLNDILNSQVNKEREEVSSKTFMEALNGKKKVDLQVPDFVPREPAQNPGTMKIHIEIERTARNGDSLSVTADIDNQSDLAAFHETYRGYLPRKKLWGLL